MPEMYEMIRDKLLAAGKGKKKAQSTAAAIYNSWAKEHGKPPMSPENPEAKPRKKK